MFVNDIKRIVYMEQSILIYSVHDCLDEASEQDVN